MSDIQGCLSIDDFSGAFNCIRKMVAQSLGKPGCQPKLVLLTQADCEVCKEGIDKHQADIDKGIIEEISIDTPEGMGIASKNDVTTVPSLLLLDCEDNMILPV